MVYPGILEWAPLERFLRHYSRIIPLQVLEAQALPDYVRCIWLSIVLQRLQECGPRPPYAHEALAEALILSDWAMSHREEIVALVEATTRQDSILKECQ